MQNVDHESKNYNNDNRIAKQDKRICLKNLED